MGLKDNICLYLTTMSELSLWHARMGHVSLETIKNMIDKKLVQGASSFVLEKEICGSCLLGKQIRAVFPQATTYRATKRLELIHGDLCGPITPSTHAGNRYIFVLIDDYSRYMWTINTIKLVRASPAMIHQLFKLLWDLHIIKNDTQSKHNN